jgi:phosphatidate cytidylyltransferase
LLITRVITGLVLGVAVTVVLLYLPAPWAAAVLGLLWVAGAWEWAGLARLEGVSRMVYAGGFLLLMLALLLGPVPGALVDLALGVAVLAWLVALAGILTYPRPITSATALAAGLFALLPAWLALEAVHASVPRGPQLALTVMALVWAADVGAYAAGRAFGRHKLAPRVSPGKTWEGVAGGVVLALLVAWAAGALLALPMRSLLAVALVTALVSVVGDLTVSMLKRNVGLKDTGRLLPGHGGVMDRIDGLVAALPFYAAGLKLFGLID